MSWLPRHAIIVPIDFSDDSFAAIDAAMELGDDPAGLHVVHALPILEPNDPGVIWETVDDRSRTEHATEAIRKELTDRGHNGLQVAIRFGDPGHEIVQYAAEVKAGAIVLSSHGQSALRHLLIGSVAERVVRLARCPVLVLKK